MTVCLHSHHFDYGSRIFSMPWFSQMERAKGTWGTENSRYSCTSVDWLLCNYFCYVRAGSPPYWAVPCEAHLYYFFFLLFFLFFCWRNEVKMGMLTKHLVVNFLICISSTMDMCISLSKEIIKHPFATCPGHHSCRLLSAFILWW